MQLRNRKIKPNQSFNLVQKTALSTKSRLSFGARAETRAEARAEARAETRAETSAGSGTADRTRPWSGTRASARLARSRSSGRLHGHSTNKVPGITLPRLGNDFTESDLIDGRYLVFESRESGEGSPTTSLYVLDTNASDTDDEQVFELTRAKEIAKTKDGSVELFTKNSDNDEKDQWCIVIKEQTDDRYADDVLAEYNFLTRLRAAGNTDLEQKCGSIVHVYPVLVHRTTGWEKDPKKVAMPKMTGDVFDCMALMFEKDKNYLQQWKADWEEPAKLCGPKAQSLARKGIEMLTNKECHKRVMIDIIQTMDQIAKTVLCLKTELQLYYFDLKLNNIFVDFVAPAKPKAKSNASSVTSTSDQTGDEDSETSKNKTKNDQEVEIRFKLGDVGSLFEPAGTYMNPWFMRIRKQIEGGGIEEVKTEEDGPFTFVQLETPTTEYQQSNWEHGDKFETYVFFALAMSLFRFCSFKTDEEEMATLWLAENFNAYAGTLYSVSQNADMLKAFSADIDTIVDWFMPLESDSNDVTENQKLVSEALDANETTKRIREKFIGALKKAQDQFSSIINFI